jgi:prenyltransferase beta subunit
MSKKSEVRSQESEVRSQASDEAVVAQLKSLAPVNVSHDLAPEILARVKVLKVSHISRLTAHVSRFTYPLAAAAAVTLLLGGLWMMRVTPADPGQQAIAWLCHTQEPDGSWSTAHWGGDKHFEVALTGLSLLTIVESSQSSAKPSIDKAIAYLIRCQQKDGQFGESFSGAPYNHGISTLALAKAYETRKDEALRLALDRAVSAICSRQYADGGWGYHQEARPASNLSVTLWQLEALRIASAQGWPQVRPNLERGLRWMAGVASDDGSFGYQARGDTPGGASLTLTAMGAMSFLDSAHIGLVSPGRRQAIKARMQHLAASPGLDMDYYRRYFLASALKKMDEESARRGLVALRHDLLSRQDKHGTDTGSWKPDDRWGSAGGRIYATALASLSLR